MLVALLLAGCRTCPPFADIAVTDPDGLAEDDELARIEATIAEFAAWTGREGVCVDEVRLLREEDLDEAAGTYFGSWIGVKAGSSVESVTRHELCHAVDSDDGGLSEQHPDLFPAASVSDGEHYPTERERTREAFARACQDGPKSIALVTALEESCPADLGSARQRLLNEAVYAAWADAGTPPEGVVTAELTRVEIEDVLVVAGPVVAGDEVWAVDEDEATGAHTLVRLDMDTGRVTARMATPTLPALLASDAGPVLVDRVAEPPAVWQLVGDTLVARAFPVVDEVYGGVADGDVAWVSVRFPGEEASTFARVDLATGAWEPLPWPEGIDTPGGLKPSPAGLWGNAWTLDGERVYAGFDPATRAWTVVDVPEGWGGSDGVAGTDGRLVATWTDALAVGREYDLTGLGLVDPADGRWWLTDRACDTNGLSWSSAILSVGDAHVVWESRAGWDEEDAYYGRGDALTRVRFP